MIKKEGFLLIELLVALTVFSLFASIFSYFIYINLNTRQITIKRSNQLNNILNFFEKNEYENSFDKKVLNIKVSKEGDYFKFCHVNKKFFDITKKQHNLNILGPA